MSNPKSDPISETIPSELVNLYECYARRVRRRSEVFEQLRLAKLKELEPLVTEHRHKVREYEDHFDEGLLRYHKDPNKMPFDERDPHEVKQARALKRAFEDAERIVRQREAAVIAELQSTAEYLNMREATEQQEDWLSEVCRHLNCCKVELDWSKRILTRSGSRNLAIPESLLAHPK